MPFVDRILPCYERTDEIVDRKIWLTANQPSKKTLFDTVKDQPIATILTRLDRKRPFGGLEVYKQVSAKPELLLIVDELSGELSQGIVQFFSNVIPISPFCLVLYSSR